MSYGIKGELTSAFAQLKSPPDGIYQRQDELHQTFSNGRLIRQDQVVRDPNTGDVSLQLAARHYYRADDRLMAVQRYSYRSAGYRDGTWEEYRYDALGRRIMTRARRDPNLIYDASFSGPLCQSSTVPVCRPFIERVWWDGDTDQALLEARSPQGSTSDVSNSGTVGNVHGLTLDEPLAVISPTTSETRIINYNWRGQGLSSVFPNGQGADYATGNAVAEIDWPAATQAETYFTPNLDVNQSNTAKKWLGTFVANGQGTTGMLYRRNRYFDPRSGRFTQEDPIGIAGGLNAYSFAEGDPINFSDPFGLMKCPPACDEVFEQLWRMAPAIETAITGATAVAFAPIAAAGAAEAVAGAGAMTTLGIARPLAGRTLLPAVPSAIAKLQNLGEKFRVSPTQLANRAITSGMRLVDNAEENFGNINHLLPRLDGASGWIRVTLDPSRSRIISAGLQSANQVINGLKSGRFTPFR